MLWHLVRKKKLKTKEVTSKSKSAIVLLNVHITRVQSKSNTLPSKVYSTQMQSTTLPPNFKKSVTFAIFFYTLKTMAGFVSYLTLFCVGKCLLLLLHKFV